jgi:hypothetical protein
MSSCQEVEHMALDLTEVFPGCYGVSACWSPVDTDGVKGWYMNGRRDQDLPMPVSGRRKTRIETQIHRRGKAKASGPMESEWDISQPQPSARLRMAPSSKQSRRRG